MILDVQHSIANHQDLPFMLENGSEKNDEKYGGQNDKAVICRNATYI